MVASTEWTEWHLTPGGWVRGSFRADFGGTTTKEPPADRVLTCRYQEIISWGTKGGSGVSELWRSPDLKFVEKLLKKHKECPAEL